MKFALPTSYNDADNVHADQTLTLVSAYGIAINGNNRFQESSSIGGIGFIQF